MMLYLLIGIEPLTLDHVNDGSGLQMHQHAVCKTSQMPLKYSS